MNKVSSLHNSSIVNVVFDWNGKTYNGELRRVSGAGNMYHLMVKNYYQGQLVRTDKGWQFSTQKHGYIDSLAIHFGNIFDLEKKHHEQE
jgi:hypothetical protein